MQRFFAASARRSHGSPAMSLFRSCPSPGSSRARCALLALLTSTVLGCAPQGPDFLPGGGAPDDTDTAELPGELNVVELDEPDSWPDCDGQQHCWEDYEAIPSLLDASCIQPTSREDIVALLEAIANNQLPTFHDDVSHTEFAEILGDAMGARCLFEGLDTRPLEVRVLSTTQLDGYQRRDLLFVDPIVGRFTAIHLVPDGAGPHPAVVAIHGHEDNAQIYLDFYNGPRFPEQGIALLALDMRANRADDLEAAVSWDFLLDGLSFMGVRSYEARLGLKYLAWRPETDPDALGLIGHSGGSVNSNLTVWIEPRVKAYVSDMLSPYFADGLGNPECTGSIEDWECIIDETTPALFQQQFLINDLEQAPAPVLRVPYGHAGTNMGADEIMSWFTDHLG
jgi:hypothetical protein